MPDSSEQERKKKYVKIIIDPNGGKTRTTVDPADILAFAALLVSVIIAIGMVFGKIDWKVGASILVAVCGGAAIAKVVGAGKGGKDAPKEG